jgi:quercetin dioxygenase-like cupin family protein
METSTLKKMRVVRSDERGPDIGLLAGGSWREILGTSTGSVKRSLYELRFVPGAMTVDLTHADEAVYYVVSGGVDVVAITAEGDRRHGLTEGNMVHVLPGGGYRFEAATSEAHLVGGPCPVDPQLGRRPASPSAEGNVRIFHRDEPGLKVPLISRDARLVVWLGVHARNANMNFVVLEPGESNKEHVHRYSEDTVHILEGHGTAVNVSAGEQLPFGPGDTVHIEPGCWHAIRADRGERVLSVGGPCPADLDMLEAAGVDVSQFVNDVEEA